ncbi:MAG: hypothetical protein EOO68_36075, partial [Moraxellaceae bacterium]
LLVTVSVIAVLAALAIPNFKTSVANNRSSGAGEELVTALNLARNEAIRRGSYVSICSSVDGTACLSPANWAKGWLVFQDAATSDTATSSVSTVIRYWNDLPATIVVTAIKTPSTAIDYVRFNNLGVLAKAQNDLQVREINVSLTSCKGQQKSKITVGLVGLITSTKVNCP